MGRQVNFRITTSDRQLLVERPRSQGAVFVPYWNDAMTPSLVDPDDYESFGTYAVREADLERVVTKHVPAQQRWVIDSDESPALECDLGGRSEGSRNECFWFSTGRWDAGEQWVPQDPDFTRWADRQIAWVRRRFSKGDGFRYDGPGAADLHSQ